jgi:DNA repair protein RadC
MKKILTPQIEISLKYKNKKSELFHIDSSVKAVECLREIYNSDTISWTEEAILICLNNDNKVLGHFKLSSGGMTGVIMDQRIIMQVALLSHASGIILSHNHPSGVLKPSDEDIKVTKNLQKCCDLFRVTLMDHIIITDESYYSFNDNGLL